MTPALLNIDDLLGSNNGFYIPSFQRDYSWTDDDVTQLLSDFHETLRTAASKDSTYHDFFLGTVITYDGRGEVEKTISEVALKRITVGHVIDGQQRLTTLILILAVVYDWLKSLTDELQEHENELPGLKALIDTANELLVTLISCEEFESNKTSFPKLIRYHKKDGQFITDMWALPRADARTTYTSDIGSFLAERVAESRSVSAKAMCQSSRHRGKLNDVVFAIDRFFQEMPQRLGDDLFQIGTFLSLESRFLDGEALSELESISPDDPRVELITQSCYLITFVNTILNCTNVVHIPCDDINQAFDMYQTINGTGVDLTVIEVMKPDLHQRYLGIYESNLHPCFTKIQESIKGSVANNARNKSDLYNKLTNELVAAQLRSYHGLINVPKFFGNLQRSLRSYTASLSPSEITKYMKCMAGLAEFNQFAKAKTASNSAKSNKYKDIRTELMRLNPVGPDSWEQADLLLTLISFLATQKNDLGLAVVAVFYSRLKADFEQMDNNQRAKAFGDVIKVAKICSAFWILWKGLDTKIYPDHVYKLLFTGSQNITHSSGCQNQNADFVRSALLDGLKQLARKEYKTEFTMDLWSKKFAGMEVYKNKQLIHFALLLAHHDAEADLRSGHAGELRDGTKNSSRYLTCDNWCTGHYEIEHIQPQTLPAAIQYPGNIDADLYSDANKHLINTIGNLTLLTRSENSAIGNKEWPEKFFFYWSLTNRGQGTQISEQEMLKALNIQRVPPSLSALNAGTRCVNHLLPIVQLGLSSTTHAWDRTTIETRGLHFSKRLFNKLLTWL